MPALSEAGSLFHAVELQARDLTVAVDAAFGHASRPRLSPLPEAGAAEAIETLRYSDTGYRSLPTDAVRAVYPPLLQRAVEIDRAIPLAPGASAVGASWGSLVLVNPAGALDALAASRSPDGQAIRVLVARKALCPVRRILIDPPYEDFSVLFAGVAKGWRQGEQTIDVPLYDATYYLEAPLQGTAYVGTGTVEGAAALAGALKPLARGGTSGDPIRDVAPVLIDPVNRVYAWNDGPGTLTALYEGGKPTITFQADTTNLWTGTTNPGQYRTDVSRSLLQLGSEAQGPITIDCTGKTRTGATVTTAAAIAKAMLLSDLSVDPAMVDSASFDALDAAFPYVSGWAWGHQTTDAISAVSLFLAGIGAKLLPTRDGRLRAASLRALTGSETPAASWTDAEVVSVTPVSLGAPLDPPPFRWRIAYQRCHTVLRSGFNETIDAARQKFLAEEWRFAAAASPEVQAAYRRPSDPDAIGTALLKKADADALAADMVALWGTTRRRLFDVAVPMALGVARDLGDVIRLRYPIGDLRAGALGRIVAERWVAGGPTIVFRVLI